MRTVIRPKLRVTTLIVAAMMFVSMSSANAWLSQSGEDQFGEPEGRLETYFINGVGTTDELGSEIDWTLLLLCLNQKFQIFIYQEDRDYKGNLSNAKVEVKFSKNGPIKSWRTKSVKTIGDSIPRGIEFLEPKKLAKEMEKTREFFIRFEAPKFIPPKYAINFNTSGLKVEKKVFKKNCAW